MPSPTKEQKRKAGRQEEAFTKVTLYNVTSHHVSAMSMMQGDEHEHVSDRQGTLLRRPSGTCSAMACSQKPSHAQRTALVVVLEQGNGELRPSTATELRNTPLTPTSPLGVASPLVNFMARLCQLHGQSQGIPLVSCMARLGQFHGQSHGYAGACQWSDT